MTNAKYKRQFSPIDETCDCYTCQHYTAAYLNHLFKGKEMLAATLATIHNERFIIRLVADMREAIIRGDFFELKEDFMGRFYGQAT
jgi:queuine tRNA-ribosyltransferase